MKILQVAKYYHPAPGGIETFQKDLAESLVKKNISVTVYSFNHDAHAREIMQENINGVDVRRFPTPWRALSQPLSLDYYQAVRRLRDDYDLIHCQSLNPLGELAINLGATRRPIVTTFHHDLTKQWFLKPFYGPLLQSFLRRNQKIYVSSPDMRTAMPSLENHWAKTEVIPFGIKGALPADPALTAELRHTHGKYCLFVGRLVHYKCLDVLLRAFPRDAGYKLLIVGDGPERSKLEKLRDTLGLQSRLVFLGSLPQVSALGALYRAAEFFVLPSAAPGETFGYVLIEAMAAGKALITSDFPAGMRWVNEAGRSGLHYQSTNESSLRQALLELMHNEELRTRLGHGARQRFSEQFTLDKMADRYVQSFADVLRGNPA